jgi:hypothetical protein
MLGRKNFLKNKENMVKEAELKWEKKRHQAATKIQAMGRGYNGRRHFARALPGLIRATQMRLFCVECERQVATRRCLGCKDKYCVGCYAKLHKKGERLYHSWLPTPGLTRQQKRIIRANNPAALGDGVGDDDDEGVGVMGDDGDPTGERERGVQGGLDYAEIAALASRQGQVGQGQGQGQGVGQGVGQGQQASSRGQLMVQFQDTAGTSGQYQSQNQYQNQYQSQNQYQQQSQGQYQSQGYPTSPTSLNTPQDQSYGYPQADELGGHSWVSDESAEGAGAGAGVGGGEYKEGEWDEYFDDSAQAKYWFNRVTGEAVWVNPYGGDSVDSAFQH